MLIGKRSKYLLKKTRAKTKMIEYNVPHDEHISVEPIAIELLLTTIGIIGNASNEIWNSKMLPLSISENSKKELEFSSLFFDALFQSQIEESNRDYYILLGAIAYYFCDKIGSSIVLANELDDSIDFGSSSIDKVILALLSDRVVELRVGNLENKYKDELLNIIHAYNSYFEGNIEIDFTVFNTFKDQIYSEGSDRELLLGDALLAIFKKKITNSALNLMPRFSGMDKGIWRERLIHQRKLKELWSAQLRFGEFGIYSGKSGVIQMPTSSGKTTSIALTVQSSFLSNRTKTAIIVAPFRSLCKEIHFDLEKYFDKDYDIKINELSDIPDKENVLNMLELEKNNQKSIIILTPEKLIYLLRRDKLILEKMGLIIFDEAHLFDDSSRGTNYELLLSTIKYYIKESESDIQKILISAVIPNADKLNEWINGEDGVVIVDNTIVSTEKTISFSDWNVNKDSGYLYFVNPENPNELEYYVPRVVKISKINKLSKERKERLFPEITASDMAIYFAVKLNGNGAVAVFCGTKVTANSILNRFLDIEQRGYDISSLLVQSKDNENKKIANLISENYGEENDYYKASQKGVLIHHSGISNGIRNAVEFAMKEDLVRCVVCTSTLAQGVNLPIKYLLVSGIYQAGEKIKVRDFHNLIGRTGRAGKHTEGSVILTEPGVYQKKDGKFKSYTKLLDSNNSEECLSNILRIIQPFEFYDKKSGNLSLSFLRLLPVKYSNIDDYEITKSRVRKLFQNTDTWVLNEFENRLTIFENSLRAIENYMLDFYSSVAELSIEDVIVQTFGYYLANENEKKSIRTVFKSIEEYMKANVDAKDIPIYSGSQLGIQQSIKLNFWVQDNIQQLIGCLDSTEILRLITIEVVKYSENKVLHRIISKSELINLAVQWINGDSYDSIYRYCQTNEIQIQDKRKKKTQQRLIKLEEIIELCDNGFGYAMILTIHAIGELILSSSSNGEEVYELINHLCQKMRYGLSAKKDIIIYELGFSDRIIAKKVSKIVGNIDIHSKNRMKQAIRLKKENVKEELLEYPAYYIDRLKQI